MPSFTVLGSEYVEINNCPLSTPAWLLEDIAPFWDLPAIRGSDRLIPFTDGQSPLRRRKDTARVQTAIWIFGDSNWNNTPYSNVRQGLVTNRDELVSLIGLPSTSDADPTWDLVVHMPDGSTRGAGCFVNTPFGFEGRGPHAMKGVLDVTIPGGVLQILTS